jgi:hypothetical protein
VYLQQADNTPNQVLVAITSDDYDRSISEAMVLKSTLTDDQTRLEDLAPKASGSDGVGELTVLPSTVGIAIELHEVHGGAAMLARLRSWPIQAGGLADLFLFSAFIESDEGK